MRAFAAYRKDCDWIPISSIGASKAYSATWITEKYVSGHEKFRVVSVNINVVRPRKKKRVRR